MNRPNGAALVAVLIAAAVLPACGRKTIETVSQADQTFMASNRKNAGVTALASGLQYKIIRSGPTDGPHPERGDEVKVNYSGSLISGSVFDSTLPTGQPAVLKLDGLVPGWMQALPLMRPGDEWLLYVPPSLGYGAQGHPPVIPPNSVLVFDLSLLGVLKTSNTQMGSVASPKLASPKLAILDASSRPGL